jgi:hypothetical protein
VTLSVPPTITFSVPPLPMMVGLTTPPELTTSWPPFDTYLMLAVPPLDTVSISLPRRRPADGRRSIPSR